MLNSESEKRSNERLKTLHRRKKKYERLRSSPIEQKQSENWCIIQQENKERFRNFLDSLGDVAYEADASGNVSYVNKMAEKITGMPLGDIIGKPFLPLFKKESQQIAIDVYERALNGESTEYELTFTNGRICHFKNKPLRDENGKIIGVFGIARDITERKEVDKALRESEERFRNLFNNALVGLYRTTPDGRILMANPTIVRMLGYDSFEELANRNLEEEGFEPGYFRSDFKKRVDASGIVIGLEADWVRRDGTILSVRESAKAIRDELGNVLYYEGTVEDITERKQAEDELKKHRDHLEEIVAARTSELEQKNKALQTEITERKRTEESLRQSENRYRTVIENAGVGIVVVQDKMLCFVNPQHTSVTGRSREESMSRPFMEFIHPDDRERVAEVHAARLRGEQVPSVYEFRIIDKNGRTRWLENNGILIEWDGKPASLHFLRDITAQKNAEEALRERDEMIRALVETSRDWIWSIDLNGVHTYCNPAVEQILGYSPDELVGKRSLDVIHDDDRRMIEANLPTWITEKRGWSNLMLRWQHKNGTYRYLESNAVPILNPENELVGFRGVDRDITDRRKAEEALMMSELRFRSLIEQTTDAVFCYEYDPPIPTDLPREEQVMRLYDGVLVECNDVCAKSYGAEHAEDVIGKRLTELFGAMPGSLDELFTEMIEGGYRTVDGKGVKRLEDGTERYYLNNGHGVIEDGKLVRVWGTFRDITERMRSEEALRETTNLLETIFEHTHMLVACLDSQFNFVRVNRAYAEADDREPSFFPGKNHFDLYPNEENEAIFRRVIETGIPYFTYAKSFEYAEHPERGISYWDWSLVPIKNQQGIASGLVLTLADVTARKRTEEALRESEEKFRSLAEQSPNMIFINKKGKVVYVNKKCEEVMGYKREELCSPDFDFCTLIAPESLSVINDNFAKHLRGEEVRPYDYCLINKKGERIEAINASKLVQYEGEVAILGVVTDITERKRAEQALRDSEERLKILFESAPDAIYLIDSEGRIVDGNWAAVKLIGYPKEEVFGKTLGEMGLLSGEQLSKAEANLKKVATGKLSGPNEYNLKRKDGTHVSIEVRTFPVKIEGKILTLGIARDITEHKRTEKELLEHQAKLKSLASQLSLTEERERHRLATDLHDQISQSLVISKIKLDQLRKSSSSDEFNKPLKDISNCLGQTIDDTRALTFDLSYPILYELGFEAAVAEWLADQIQEKHGIKTEFLDDGNQKPLDDDIRVLLFRNVRELLINVVKHAQANKVRVSIRKHKDNICVSIEDDGVGFDPVEATSLAIKRAELGLFSVRERLEQLGGMIKIESEKGRGSRIIMTAPLKYNNSTDRTQDEY